MSGIRPRQALNGAGFEAFWETLTDDLDLPIQLRAAGTRPGRLEAAPRLPGGGL